MRSLVVALCLTIGCGRAAAPTAVTLATQHAKSAGGELGPLHPTRSADPEAATIDARAWATLADWLCKNAGAVDYGAAVGEIENTPYKARVTSTDVSFGLPRSAFFDANDGKLHPETVAWLERVVATLAKLPAGATLVVTTTLEDDVQSQSVAARSMLAAQRMVALREAIVAAGLDRSRVDVKGTIEAWEGSYDGPAILDPADGRVTFAVTRY